MKELLSYIISGITGSNDFDIVEENGAEGQTTLKVKADKAIMGLIIGKEGNTIKAIQTLVRVRARLEDKQVYVSIEEKGS